MKIARTFNGTGATVTLGLGFIPDWVRAFNLESTLPIELFWSRQMRAAAVEGMLHTATTYDMTSDPDPTSVDAVTRLAFGAGIAPYAGGDKMTAASTAYLVAHANPDFKDQGSLGKINAWTLGSAGNRTGNFNVGIPTTYVGVGSRVRIRETASGLIRTANITALTNDGDAANEITLNLAIKNGELQFLGPMYDLVGAAAGVVIPCGIVITNNTFNASGNVILVEAGTYDD